MKKEFGSLSKKQIIALHKHIYNFISKIADDFDLIDLNEIDTQFSLTWYQLYELEISQITYYLIKILNLDSEVQKAINSGDANEYFLNLFASDFEPNVDFRDLQPVQLATTYSCVICLLHNFACFASHRVSINQLIKEANQGSVESLFKAIHIDSSVVCTPIASQRISHATMVGDDIFFKKLSKAVECIHLKKPVDKYSMLNFFTHIIESTPRSILNEEALHDLFTIDLKLYPDVNELKDSPGSLKRQLDRTRHKVKDIKS